MGGQGAGRCARRRPRRRGPTARHRADGHYQSHHRIADPSHADEEQIICIITDGAENASTDFNPHQIKELIEARTEASFAFIFLGANQDSFTAAETLGMQRGNTRNFAPSGPGARRVFEEVSGTVAQQRGRTPEERLFQKDELLAARIPEGEILGVEPLGQEPNGRPHR